MFAAGQTSAFRAVEFPNGSWIPDEILTNAGRRLAGHKIYEEYATLTDLTGGVCASLPTEKSFYAAEETHRVMRMMENKLCDPFEGAHAVAGIHGGGSPLMETITMMSRHDLEPLKNIAKYLAGFKDVKFPRYERPTVTPCVMLDKFKELESKS